MCVFLSCLLCCAMWVPRVVGVFVYVPESEMLRTWERHVSSKLLNSWLLESSCVQSHMCIVSGVQCTMLEEVQGPRDLPSRHRCGLVTTEIDQHMP